MGTAKKTTKTKKTSIVKKKASKQVAMKKVAAKKAVVKKSAIKKKTAKVAVKKKLAKSAVKKKAVKALKKSPTKSITKKKIAAKVSPVVSKTKQLRATVAALKQEIQELKIELKSSIKRADAVVNLSGQRDAAVEKFIKGWDKKAMSALEKSLSPKKKKKSKK